LFQDPVLHSVYLGQTLFLFDGGGGEKKKKEKNQMITEVLIRAAIVFAW